MLSIEGGTPKIKSSSKHKKTTPPKKEVILKPRPKLRAEPKRVPKPPDWQPPRYRVIAKKQLDVQNAQNLLSTIPGFLLGLTKDLEDSPTKLYDYQVEHILDNAIFRAVDKARQIGESYVAAGEALAKCHLKNNHTSIFISFNHEEAMEKIRFARALYDSMPTEFKKELVVDNKQSLEFERHGKLTRILSFAQRQPRGKGTNTDILLDEFAHMMWAREIYAAAVPVLSRGSGVLTVASTPLGKNTLHYEIMNNREDFPEFSRMRIPWWYCPELCSDVERAREEAPLMDTEDRVKKFGTKRFRILFRNMEDVETFKQEYELFHIDESVSYYPLDLIRTCTFEDENKLILEPNIDPEEVPVGFAPIEDASGLMVPDTIMNHYSGQNINWNCEILTVRGDEQDYVDRAKEVIDQLALSMSESSYGRDLLLGMDIGRERDSSEISILEEVELPTHNIHIERLMLELDRIPFRDQEEVVRHCLQIFPNMKKVNIDATGHGSNLAENLELDFPQVVEGIKFDLENKAEMAKNFRFRLEDRAIALYNDTRSVRQIHSIKKKITDSANITYTAEKNKKHHGDKFWSKALASVGGTTYDRNRVVKRIIRIGNEQRAFSINQKQKDNNSVIRISNRSIIPVQSNIGGYRTTTGLFNGMASMSDMFTDNKYYG